MDSRSELYEKVAKKAFAKYPGCVNAIKTVILPITDSANKKEVETAVTRYVGTMPGWSKVCKGFPKLQMNYNSYTHPLKPGRMVILNFQTSLSAN